MRAIRQKQLERQLEVQLTDDVAEALRQELEAAGADIRFNARLEHIRIQDGAVSAVTVCQNGQTYDLPARHVLLALGHSARDTFEMLHRVGLYMVPKPFAMGEFISRVRALTRRSGNYAPDVICVGGTSLDLSSYTLSSVGGGVRLNNKEFQLMELFMRNRGRVFSTDALMQKVWDLDTESETDVVWTYIGFLRKKLRQLDADVEIKTIRGAGYALEAK